MIFQTSRLLIRKAVPESADIKLFYDLWTDPRVMVNVGFPSGLQITPEEIAATIRSQTDSEFDKKLIVELRETKALIGECKLGLPDLEGISETDIKLLPEYWGHGYGTELKHGLVEYLFAHTECRAVKATPNVNNIASCKMQESAGGKLISEDIYHFPDHMRDYTCDVHHYIYLTDRQDWEKKDK